MGLVRESSCAIFGRETSGEVRVFSSLHVSGEQLAQLTGVAAILRFPCPEIERRTLLRSSLMTEIPPLGLRGTG